MIEPLGYLDIILQSLEVFSLIGLLVLFFLERTGYGRGSIGRDSWPTILVYNIMTLGAYGIYWRLKVSYALHSRDRLSSWQWHMLLILVFIVYVIDIRLLTLLTLWDFFIGSRLHKTTGEPVSWFWTLVCGHLYLASYVEREADRLPLDFRVERTDRRPRIVTVYCAAVLGAVAAIGVSLWALVQQRAEKFANIPSEAVDRSGRWYETHERYDRIYREDKNGHRDVFFSLKKKSYKDQSEWAHYGIDTKMHDGKLYTYNWFSCVESQEVVESTPTILVVKNAWDQSSVESPVDEEQFSAKLQDFQRSSRMPEGWEYGALLRSPWSCELSFIPQAWNQAMDFSQDLIMRYIFLD